MNESSPLVLKVGAQRWFGVGTRRWRLGRAGLAIGLTLASLTLLALNARLPAFGDLLAAADRPLVGLALLISTATLVAKAARWCVLFPAQVRPGLGLATAGIAVGQMINWALPTRLGDVARLGLVNPHGRDSDSPGFGEGLGVGAGVLVAEKAVDLGMLILTTALLIGVAGVPEWLAVTGLSLSVGIAVLLVGACLVLRPRLRQFERAIGALALGLTSWWSVGRVLRVLAWSALAWGGGALVNGLVIHGLDPRLSAPALAGASLSLLVALYGGAVVPALPGRLGIFQAACVLALLPFGLSFDEAVGVSVVMYAVVYLPPLVLGLLALVLVRPLRAGARTSAATD